MGEKSLSWIYLYSKFTSELLVIIASAVFLIITAYAAYWIVRKRRHGVLGSRHPQQLVKGVLNELNYDAEQLRAQLFGLLASSEFPAVSVTALRPGGSPGSVPVIPATADSAQLAPQLALLEAKMAEQAKAMQSILADKARLETELAQAKTSPGGGGDDSALREKIQALEARLAEYSVIEDDLANLKRLQQENAALKAQLAGKGETPAIPTAAPIAAAPATPPPAVEAPPPVSAPAAEPIEKLAQETQQNLAPPAESEPAPLASKSDADLIAEFEKMLNG